jgi:hypothetical protein
MQEIRQQGKTILVDDEDYDRLNEYRWCIVKNYKNLFYVTTTDKGNRIYMHRLLCEGDEIDHINGDGLDNRKCNLESVSHRENIARGKSKGRSLPTGVSLTKPRKQWTKPRVNHPYQAGIQINGKSYNLGLFATPEEASAAYQHAKKHGVQ